MKKNIILNLVFLTLLCFFVFVRNIPKTNDVIFAYDTRGIIPSLMEDETTENEDDGADEDDDGEDDDSDELDEDYTSNATVGSAMDDDDDDDDEDDELDANPTTADLPIALIAAFLIASLAMFSFYMKKATTVNNDTDV